jgi:hypothetical protein
MKVLAVLDVGVYVFDDVFGKWRGEDTAVTERTMTEFRATLTPRNDLLTAQQVRHFTTELFFTGHVFINDFGVVQYRLNLRRSETRAEREMTQPLARVTAGVFASKESSAQGGSGIAGDGLDMNVFEAAAVFPEPERETRSRRDLPQDRWN